LNYSKRKRVQQQPNKMKKQGIRDITENQKLSCFQYLCP